MEEVVNQVREVLLGKRFLIVVDDLWTESRDKLQKLLRHLVGGQVGSWIVVTTRSNVTAKIMGESVKYELEGLSDAYSWQLFRQTAFDKIDHESPNGSYMDKLIIGKDIIKTCANVPLAIRVIGGLLYGQKISEWRQLKKFGLANSSEGESGIISILKHSYNYLDYWLKSCFSYCSLYPKDYSIEKDTLIRLWIAQGYVMSRENGQTVEDVGEDYFLVLLRRCFFQDVKKDGRGQIVTFKLHDLMHDVALEVSNKEICPTSYFSRYMDKAVRHVCLTKKPYANFDLINAHVRTILIIDGYFIFDIKVLRFENYRRLRTLDLSYLRMKILPDSIGKLIHLRHLNLSENYMEVLPNSITKLYNLQTLYLNKCGRLKELPKNFSNLVNLKVLILQGCNNLTLMPFIITRMSKLIHLVLDIFKVGVIDSSLKQPFQGLKALKMIRGSITIEIHMPSSYVHAIEDNTITEGGYIRDMEHLDTIDLTFNHGRNGVTDYDEEFLGALEPHENLKDLTLYGYKCVRMPRSWAIEDNSTSVLRNLVQLKLANCCELKYLPSLGNLQNLKKLELSWLPNLEYMETSGQRSQFFPCLQDLTLVELPKFKGWGRTGEIVGIPDSHLSSSLVFSKLIRLEIYLCGNLTCVLECPNVKNLYLSDFSERLRINSVPISLTTLTLSMDKEVENLSDYGGFFGACSSSLRELKISSCSELRSISGGLRYLTALERLTLIDLPVLDLGNEDEEIEGDVECDGMPWGALSHTLQYLEISWCRKLKTFPKWMRKLTSLQRLDIFECSTEVYERCQNPNGEDRPNIQHIPRVHNYEPISVRRHTVVRPITKWTINDNGEVENLSDYGGFFGACSLRELEISSCSKLRSISEGLRYLTALERLTLRNLPILDLGNEDEEIEGDVECDGMPWGALSHTLQYLKISYCEELKTFSKWMRKLTSLQQLDVEYCSKELYERCQNPNGEDWPNIQHIPRVHITREHCGNM